MNIFYSNGTFKKKRYEKVSASAFGIKDRLSLKVWFGAWEPEPRTVSSKLGMVNKLPKKFLPPPAYKGAK